ncbi:MAG: butyrate kinase [Clostridia bacterium]|nr:butyrate kinase [Clostridia bacterium]
MKRILAINPGSTSTKVALYADKEVIFVETIDHPMDELKKYSHVQDQFDFRKEVIIDLLTKNDITLESLDAVVGRGGLLPPVKSGAYMVNELMIDRLKNRPVAEHASNLGALISYEIAQSVGIDAYIYDSIAVDELSDVARVSGLPELPRISLTHTLNARATAHKVAEKHGKKYEDMKLIVAHLGGGISVSVHDRGRMIDTNTDEEGPFSPERAGRVPCGSLVDLCYSGEYDHRSMRKKLRGNGGLKAYLGIVDARAVESLIAEGNEEAAVIYEAMAYQVAKAIGELATVLCGEVDAIVLTGGIAYSKKITDWITERVKFIAPVEIFAGENELESLAFGTLRVLNGEEEAREYTE